MSPRLPKIGKGKKSATTVNRTQAGSDLLESQPQRTVITTRPWSQSIGWSEIQNLIQVPTNRISVLDRTDFAQRALLRNDRCAECGRNLARGPGRMVRL